MIEHEIGITISETTTPAMKVEDVKSGRSVLKIGIQPRWSESHRLNEMMCGCRKIRPHSPYTMLGTAAIRSTTEMRVPRNRRGAYSEMYNAAANDAGSAMTSATR